MKIKLKLNLAQNASATGDAPSDTQMPATFNNETTTASHHPATLNPSALTTSQQQQHPIEQQPMSRSKKKLKMKGLQETMESCLPHLIKKDQYNVFQVPVNLKEVPDYAEVIKHPMDFSTIRRKVNNREYRHFDEFKRHVYLICDNAMKYNSPGTVYHKSASKLKEFAEKMFARLEPCIDYTIRADSSAPVMFADTPGDGAISLKYRNEFADSVDDLSSVADNGPGRRKKRKYTKKKHLQLSDTYYNDGTLAVLRKKDIYESHLPLEPFPFTHTFNHHPEENQKYPSGYVPALEYRQCASFGSVALSTLNGVPGHKEEQTMPLELTVATEVYGGLKGRAYAESLMEFARGTHSAYIQKYVEEKISYMTAKRHTEYPQRLQNAIASYQAHSNPSWPQTSTGMNGI
jgi:hypothetical protein